MERRSFPSQLIKVLRSLYYKTMSHICIVNYQKRCCWIDIPTKKVWGKSPYGFVDLNIYVGDIFRWWTAKVDLGISLQRNIHGNSLLYVDDNVMTQRTEEQLQRAIFTFSSFIRNYGLQISATETKTMAFKGNCLIRNKVV